MQGEIKDDDSGCGDRLTSEVTTASSSGSSDAKKARNTGAKGNSECLDCLTSEVTGSSDAMCIRNAAPICNNKLIIAAVVVITALIITIIVLAAEKSKSRPFSPPFASQGVACPVSWIGYSGKCFYVAKEERNWTLSLETCSSFNASLAVIDTQKELDFWVNMLNSDHYWFGLSRKDNGWKWSNGTEFKTQFPVRGEGFCAYINGKGASSTMCSMEKHFLCSHPERL